MTGPFRVYAPDECGPDDYPVAWHDRGDDGVGVKYLVRELAGDRCQRCCHPYTKGMGEWSPCDEQCTHAAGALVRSMGFTTEAQWRILTVHHLNGVKADLRWWNLVALCQRCHLQVQRRVVMDRPWPWPHSPWFQLHAAAWYSLKYEGRELDRDEALEHLDNLLKMGARHESIERMPL